MTHYKLSKEAKIDLAHIYWHGVNLSGTLQTEHYSMALFQRFDEIASAPFKYPAVDHRREGYRRSVCGVDSIYYRITDNVVEVMRVLGRQGVKKQL